MLTVKNTSKFYQNFFIAHSGSVQHFADQIFLIAALFSLIIFVFFFSKFLFSFFFLLISFDI